MAVSESASACRKSASGAGSTPSARRPCTRSLQAVVQESNRSSSLIERAQTATEFVAIQHCARQWLGSDYMLGTLGYNLASVQKRPGVALSAEQMAIRKAGIL